jgi:hypothetical protein
MKLVSTRRRGEIMPVFEHCKKCDGIEDYWLEAGYWDKYGYLQGIHLRYCAFCGRWKHSSVWKEGG